MASSTRYVPILKTKSGERWAIASLGGKTRKQITPLFELHENKKKKAADHVTFILDELVTDWGVDQPFFLDTYWLTGSTGQATAISATFELARKRQLKAVPVVRLGYTTQVRAAIRKLLKTKNPEFLLRLTRDEFHDSESICSLLDSVGRVEDAHLMLDYKSHSMNLHSDLKEVPRLQEWKSIIAASGTFPKSFQGTAKNRWHRISRKDYLGWWPVAFDPSIARTPDYADYTVRDPGAPAEFGAPSVNLRYTSGDVTLFYLGGLVKKGHSPEMHAACSALCTRQEYQGREFSAGDAAIADTSDKILGPGNATQWVAWCVNHHIEHTARQIADATST